MTPIPDNTTSMYTWKRNPVLGKHPFDADEPTYDVYYNSKIVIQNISTFHNGVIEAGLYSFPNNMYSYEICGVYRNKHRSNEDITVHTEPMLDELVSRMNDGDTELIDNAIKSPSGNRCIFEMVNLLTSAIGDEDTKYWHKFIDRRSTPCGELPPHAPNTSGVKVMPRYERDEHGVLTNNGWFDREGGRSSFPPTPVEKTMIDAITNEMCPLIKRDGGNLYCYILDDGLDIGDYHINCGIANTCSRCAMGRDILQSVIRTSIENASGEHPHSIYVDPQW